MKTTNTKRTVEIKPYAKNAKKHPDTQIRALADLVRKVGWRQPVLVNGKGVIVAGHGRFETWQKFGKEYGLAPLWVIDDRGETIQGAPDNTPLTPDLEAAYRLADNKLSETGWNMELVIEELKMLDIGDIRLTGFDQDLILEDNDKDDDIPEMPVKARSKLGDMYELGEHRIICGDATDGDTWEELMTGEKADMLFTDPPYNVNYAGRGKGTSEGIMNDNMSDDGFRLMLGAAFGEVRDAMKRGGGCYVFHSSSSQRVFQDVMESTGFKIKNQLIWNKPTASMGWGDYRWKHEPFFYAGFKDDKVTFYGDRTHATIVDFQKSEQELLKWIRRQKEAEAEGRTTIWTMKREPVMGYKHPTQKPVELILYALKNSSKEDDVVLDPFLGSGSTLIAAERAGRKCYGLELDPKYVDVIIERYCRIKETRTIRKNGKEATW